MLLKGVMTTHLHSSCLITQVRVVNHGYISLVRQLLETKRFAHEMYVILNYTS